MAKVQFTTPVGRLVMGSVYKPSTKDADGNPLVYKSGANVGQPRANYFLALAIPKEKGQHWRETHWGTGISAVGLTAFPQAAKSPTFAWKVTDGDDQTPNARGKRPCDTEGFPGHWILRFSGSFAPKVYRSDNGAYVQVTEPDFIKPGYYVQIAGTVDGNGSQQRPGLYLNHSMVAFSGYGQEIHFGADPNSVGFGSAPLPKGASAVPIAATNFPYGVAPAISNIPTSSTQVVPNPAFLNVPAPPSAAPTMTEKAAGASYQAFKAAGWDDAKLVAEGFMV